MGYIGGLRRLRFLFDFLSSVAVKAGPLWAAIRALVEIRAESSLVTVLARSGDIAQRAVSMSKRSVLAVGVRGGVGAVR